MSHQKSRNKRPAQTTVRLASGAGDISEGVTTTDGGADDREKGTVPFPEPADSTSNRPAGRGGYWALAPGCSDISEGMVWVPEAPEEPEK